MNSITIARPSGCSRSIRSGRSIRDEAMEAVERDPLLAAFLYSTILNQDSLEEAVIHRLAERLDHQDLGADLIRQTFKAMLARPSRNGRRSCASTSRPITIAIRPATAS